MSYSRSFTRTVSVPYDGTVTVNYPPSESGGSKEVYYRGVAYEDVEVDIYVDTEQFDYSVESCNAQVNGLTESVAAMNAAQCIAISENADKVSKTIINGFFKSVRTELSTQRAELEQTIEARLLLLRQQAETLRSKQQSMAEDYARTSARYQKIFNDINKELSVRIHEIDQPVFSFVQEIDSQNDRMLHTDMLQTALTTGKEASTLRSQIGAAMIKKNALEAMETANHFLVSKAKSERTISNSTIEGDGDKTYLIPVLYMCKKSNSALVEKEMHVNGKLSIDGLQRQVLMDKLDNMQMPKLFGNEMETLRSYVQTEISKHIKGNSSHSNRVRDLINKFINK